jgi:hypothetical protein
VIFFYIVRQHIVTFSVFKSGASFLTGHLAGKRVILFEEENKNSLQAVIETLHIPFHLLLLTFVIMSSAVLLNYFIVKSKLFFGFQLSLHLRAMLNNSEGKILQQF